MAGSHLSPGGTHPVSSSPPGQCATPSHRREGGRHLPRAPGHGKSLGPEQGLEAEGALVVVSVHVERRESQDDSVMTVDGYVKLRETLMFL